MRLLCFWSRSSAPPRIEAKAWTGISRYLLTIAKCSYWKTWGTMFAPHCNRSQQQNLAHWLDRIIASALPNSIDCITETLSGWQPACILGISKLVESSHNVVFEWYFIPVVFNSDLHIRSTISFCWYSLLRGQESQFVEAGVVQDRRSHSSTGHHAMFRRVPGRPKLLHIRIRPGYNGLPLRIRHHSWLLQLFGPTWQHADGWRGLGYPSNSSMHHVSLFATNHSVFHHYNSGNVHFTETKMIPPFDYNWKSKVEFFIRYPHFRLLKSNSKVQVNFKCDSTYITQIWTCLRSNGGTFGGTSFLRTSFLPSSFLPSFHPSFGGSNCLGRFS